MRTSTGSIRVKKISQKKNWGAATKGTADTGIEIDRFAEGGVLDGYRLACFLLRDGVIHDSFDTEGLDAASLATRMQHAGR